MKLSLFGLGRQTGVFDQLLPGFKREIKSVPCPLKVYR